MYSFETLCRIPCPSGFDLLGLLQSAISQRTHLMFDAKISEDHRWGISIVMLKPWGVAKVIYCETGIVEMAPCKRINEDFFHPG